MKNYEAGILVHGDNHFVVRGPRPEAETARALARQWSLIRIGAALPAELSQWSISTREFREELEWAIVLPGDGEINASVTQLLEELSARGIEVLVLDH
jgi:hypothetical protein